MPGINILVLPKIHSADNLDLVNEHIREGASNVYSGRQTPLSLVASIESAQAFWNLRDIASWKASFNEPAAGSLSALLVRDDFLDKDTW
jgi:citrate lyase subunit beta-like protein